MTEDQKNYLSKLLGNIYYLEGNALNEALNYLLSNNGITYWKAIKRNANT